MNAKQRRMRLPDYLTHRLEAAQLAQSQMIGMRNRLAHVYFDVDLDVVWVAVKNHLPALERYLAGLPELSGTPSEPSAGESVQ